MKLRFGLLVSLISMCAAIPSVKSGIAVHAEDVYGSIYISDVKDDLDEMGKELDEFTFQDFTFISFSEIAYSRTSSSYFDLIFYFYLNPESIYQINGEARINLAANSDNYDYHYLKLVDKSDDGFYKMCLKSPKDVYKSSLAERVYKLSDFITYKAPEDGQTEHLKDWTLGKTYKCTGYCKGMTSSGESTLQIEESGLETIELNVSVGNKMTESYGGLRKIVFYSMFNIPNRYLDDYGDLVHIKYEYDLAQSPFYKVVTPTAVQRGIELLDRFSLVDMEYVRSRSGNGINNPTYYDSDKWPVIPEWASNYSNAYGQSGGKIIQLKSIYVDSDVDTDISRSTFESEIASFGKDNLLSNHQVIDQDNIPLNVSIEENGLNSFEQWWEQYIFGIAYNDIDLELDAWEIIPKAASLESKSSISSDYYMEEEDVDNLKGLLSDLNSSTYIHRYCLGNYYSENIDFFYRQFENQFYITDGTVYAPYNTWTNYGVAGYYFVSELTLNFKYISFTFEAPTGNLTILPVVHDPLDNFISPSAPSGRASIDIWKILMMALAALFLILIVILVINNWPSLVLLLSNSNNSYRASKKVKRNKEANKKSKRK